jgi:hypothetical protein
VGPTGVDPAPPEPAAAPEPSPADGGAPGPAAAAALPDRPDWSPADFDGVGTPLDDARHWHAQTEPNSCAVVTQGAVLESVTGVPCDEQQLSEVARRAGWYDPASGTRPADVGKLLEAHGVPCEQIRDAQITDIAAALERGDKVLVGLDGTEIAAPLRDPTTGAPVEQPDAGHCVWVTGIDANPNGSIHVLVNDPGHPAGRMAPVDLLDFLNAWDDRANHLTVARTGTG